MVAMKSSEPGWRWAGPLLAVAVAAVALASWRGADATGPEASGPPGPAGERRLAIGAHVYRNDVAGRGANPMTTAPVDTRASGSTFVVFAGSGIAGETAFESVSDSLGNAYVEVGVPELYAGGEGELRAFLCRDCRGGKGHTWSLHKTASLSNWETVLFAVEVLGAPGLDAFAQANARTSPLSAGAVTTRKAGDLLLACALAASYGTPDVYTPSAGFAVLDEQTNGTNSLAGADAWARAGSPGSYAGALASSLGSSGAFFLVALSP